MLTIALVLGEFTFASLLLKNTLPTYMVVYQGSAARAGIALALLVMVFTCVLLWFVVRLMRRRGLDMLNRLQNNSSLDIQIVETDFPSVREVDLKLIELGKQLDAVIVTVSS